MERSGADRTTNSRRKRTGRVLLPPDERKGPLTDEERDSRSLAYERGCQGQVIIGLRGEERVLTMLIPLMPDDDREDEVISLSARKFREIGCDGYIHVYLKQINEKTHQFNLIVDQHVL